MSSNFNFYINRQGARGRQGIQGEQGFSPVITVNKNTASEYTLNIEKNKSESSNLQINFAISKGIFSSIKICDISLSNNIIQL